MAGPSNELLPTGDQGLRAGLVPPEYMICAPGDGHTDACQIAQRCGESSGDPSAATAGHLPSPSNRGRVWEAASDNLLRSTPGKDQAPSVLLKHLTESHPVSSPLPPEGIKTRAGVADFTRSAAPDLLLLTGSSRFRFHSERSASRPLTRSANESMFVPALFSDWLASWALANLAEKARNLNLNLKGKESKRHCEEHEEELKLFCETDKTLICLICRDAQEHREHRFKPIKEAVKIYKDQIKSSLNSLTKKKSDFQKKEQQQKEKISGVRKQSPSIQTYITSQFAELRQIITEKEQSLLRDLKEEEKRILDTMEKNLLALQENIRIIQEEITKLKEQMDQKDGVIFLKEEAHWNRRISDDVQELSVTDEALPVEKFDHLYLLNTVLRETLDAINRGKTYKDSFLPVQLRSNLKQGLSIIIQGEPIFIIIIKGN
ncbi:uncharacterized protein [Hemitrygon akajei]|uniref:uncharacterized protein n=1 Tax=Hemitrygon akajei TaxID=2704970 RepID=UPI003BFA1DEB